MEELVPAEGNRFLARIAGLDVDWDVSENFVRRIVRRTVAKWKWPYDGFFLDTSDRVYLAAFRISDGRRIWHRRMDRGGVVPAGSQCFLVIHDESGSSAAPSEISSCSVRTGARFWSYPADALLSNVLNGTKGVYLISTSNSPRSIHAAASDGPVESRIVAIQPRTMANRLTRF